MSQISKIDLINHEFNKCIVTMDKFLSLVNYTNEISFEEIVPQITKAPEKMNINEVHMTRCGCGCRMMETFWNHIPYGLIRLDVLRYLVEQKILDLDNEEIREKILGSLETTLTHSGVENNEGMMDRIHFTTLLLFELLQKYLLTYRSKDYQVSLLHSAFYGYDPVRKVEYVAYLLDQGMPLCLTLPCFEDDVGVSRLDQLIQQNLLTRNNVGQSPIYLATKGNYPEILSRMLQMDNSKEHLRSYDMYYHPDKKIRKISPIIPALLFHYAEAKISVWFVELAANLKTLIDHGYDITLPVYYVSENGFVTHNITDYLRYYQYDYPNSPIMSLFNDLPNGEKLPAPLDPEFKYFPNNARKSYDSDYDMVLKKYQYLKDPTKYNLIIDDLRTLMRNETLGECGHTAWWSHVPSLDNFAEELRVRNQRINNVANQLVNLPQNALDTSS